MKGADGMKKQEYLKLLVEEIHSAAIATIGADGHPQTRVIDMMLWDEGGVYFLTAKGKAFYAQLMEQAPDAQVDARPFGHKGEGFDFHKGENALHRAGKAGRDF